LSGFVLASSFETGGKLIKKTRAGERKFLESRLLEIFAKSYGHW
jgi:hypothetical protein